MRLLLQKQILVSIKLTQPRFGTLFATNEDRVALKPCPFARIQFQLFAIDENLLNLRVLLAILLGGGIGDGKAHLGLLAFLQPLHGVGIAVFLLWIVLVEETGVDIIGAFHLANSHRLGPAVASPPKTSSKPSLSTSRFLYKQRKRLFSPSCDKI